MNGLFFRRLRRSFAALLSLALLLTLPVGFGAAAEDLAAYGTKSNGCPYYIMVNRQCNAVTVYRQDEAGYYTVPERAMICSAGRPNTPTPLGTFSITGQKQPWCYMLDGSYGQYSSQFSGYFLFHSVCYSRADPGALLIEEYNQLGEAASMGCVRLQTADAKWIYDNCGKGTYVTVYDSEDPGPLGKPERAVFEITPELDNGWDPTDPREQNPWHSFALTELGFAAAELTVTAGESCPLTLCHTPAEAELPPLSWTSDSPAVAEVDAAGRVTALSAGTAEITAACGLLRAVCTVTVTGELLPFTDLVPGAWYYGDIRRAVNLGRLEGRGGGRFAPEDPVTFAEAVQILYNLAGRPDHAAEAAGKAEQAEKQTEAQPWYVPALTWADGSGLLGEKTEIFSPDAPIPRQDFALLLWRYSGTLPRGTGTPRETALSGFSDADTAEPEVRSALGWMVSRGLLKGTGDGLLRPGESMTRAQLAAILNRWG